MGSALLALRSGVCFHPSFQVGGDVAQLAGAVNGPLMLAPCGDDPPDVQRNGLVEQVVGTKRSDFRMEPFPEMLHGFMMRGPLEDPASECRATFTNTLSSSSFVAIRHATRGETGSWSPGTALIWSHRSCAVLREGQDAGAGVYGSTWAQRALGVMGSSRIRCHQVVLAY